MSPKGPVNCEFLCYQFDGVLVLDLAARIWPFPPPPHFCCFLFIFLQSNKDAEIWRIPMGAELFRQSIVLWREMEEVVRVATRKFVRKAWVRSWDDCEIAQLGTVLGSCLARVVSESSHTTAGSKCVTELCLWLKDSLSYICCLSPTYGGDRDLCFGSRGSLGELFALIWTDDFVGWRCVMKVWLGCEAARRALGSWVQVCRQVWLGWVMACQAGVKSGWVPGINTPGELLNTEKLSWAQVVPEPHVVRDWAHVLNEYPHRPALFCVPAKVCAAGLCQCAGWFFGVSYNRCSSERSYCRNGVKQRELRIL